MQERDEQSSTKFTHCCYYEIEFTFTWLHLISSFTFLLHWCRFVVEFFFAKILNFNCESFEQDLFEFVIHTQHITRLVKEAKRSKQAFKILPKCTFAWVYKLLTNPMKLVKGGLLPNLACTMYERYVSLWGHLFKGG